MPPRKPHTCATIPKNSQEEIRITLDTFKGVELVNIRVYAEFAGPAKAKGPTAKGIAFQTKMLPDIIAGLILALDEARAQGRCPTSPLKPKGAA